MLDSDITHEIVPLDGRSGCRKSLPGDKKIVILDIKRTRSFLLSVIRLRRLVLRRKPDLVLTYNWGAIEAVLGSFLAGKRPVVHHEEGFREDEVEKRLLRRNMARMLILRLARVTIVPSRTLLNIARKEWKLPPEKVEYIPNGIDLERFKPSKKEGGVLKVGSMGSLRKIKDFGLLIRAFGMSKAARDGMLLIAGVGEEKEKLECLIKDLGMGDKIRLVGFVEEQERFYRDLDIFALSSMSEQMPISVLEAMACGLPIVATDVGDVKDMVGEKNKKYIVGKREPGSIAGALDLLAEDREERIAAGMENRKKCEREFNATVNLQRFASTYFKYTN